MNDCQNRIAFRWQLIAVLLTTIWGCSPQSPQTAANLQQQIGDVGGKLTIKEEFILADLSKSRVTDQDLGRFSGLDRITHLTLDHTAITDDGLANLKFAMHLQSLDLRNTQITDYGLEHLKGLKTLKCVALDHCNLTKVGMDDLERALPDALITATRDWEDGKRGP